MAKKKQRLIQIIIKLKLYFFKKVYKKSMPIKQQTLYSNYYFTQPLKHGSLNFSSCVPIGFNKMTCPFYAPFYCNGVCRLCYLNPDKHRKYFIFSNYARKIQRSFLNFKFKKFYKANHSKFLRNHSIYPVPALVLIFKKKYYRKWTEYSLNNFLKLI